MSCCLQQSMLLRTWHCLLAIGSKQQCGNLYCWHVVPSMVGWLQANPVDSSPGGLAQPPQWLTCRVDLYGIYSKRRSSNNNLL